METTDSPSASTDNHGAPGPSGSPLLDADPLQPRALAYLADWEIKEFILRMPVSFSGGGMSPEVPVLRGRRGAWKIDRLEFHSNDVFLHVR